jgi:hypothetical protein
LFAVYTIFFFGEREDERQWKEGKRNEEEENFSQKEIFIFIIVSYVHSVEPFSRTKLAVSLLQKEKESEERKVIFLLKVHDADEERQKRLWPREAFR